MDLIHLSQTNNYVGYILLVFSILRVSRLALDDKITAPLRNKLIRYVKVNDGQAVARENIVDIKTGELYEQPGKIVNFFREQFSCSWCLPFWITLAIVVLTINFPGTMAIFNLIFATSFIVSYLYGEMA